MPSSCSVLGRRRFLASSLAVAGSVAVAGCRTIWSQPGATDVVVHNLADDPLVVSVVVTPAGDDEPHTSRRLDVAAGETVDPVNDAKLPANAEYTVAVDVDGGPDETFEWTDVDVERAPLHVVVDGTRNVTFLLQVG